MNPEQIEKIKKRYNERGANPPQGYILEPFSQYELSHIMGIPKYIKPIKKLGRPPKSKDIKKCELCNDEFNAKNDINLCYECTKGIYLCDKCKKKQMKIDVFFSCSEHWKEMAEHCRNKNKKIKI